MSHQNLNSNASDISRTTSTLFLCGVLAGPLFLLLFAIQIPLRPEFHFASTEPSLLSLGPLGWIQIFNFILGGTLAFAGALAIRRTLRSSKVGFFASLSLMVFAAGQIGVGVFLVDPPPSNPPVSPHGTLHVICGAISFLALMIASFLFVRVFLGQNRKRAATLCALTGLFLVASFFIAGRARQSGANVQLFLNLVWVYEWLAVSLIAARIRHTACSPQTE